MLTLPLNAILFFLGALLLPRFGMVAGMATLLVTGIVATVLGSFLEYLIRRGVNALRHGVEPPPPAAVPVPVRVRRHPERPPRDLER